MLVPTAGPPVPGDRGWPSGVTSIGGGWPARAKVHIRWRGRRGVEAAPPGDRRMPGPGAGLRELGGDLVQVSEQFCGGLVKDGQGVNRGAQPSHGGGGVDAVSHDVANDQGDPVAGQLDGVHPVPADAFVPV